MILGVDVFDRCGTDSAVTFSADFDEKHDFSDAVFLVDGYNYLIGLARIGLSDRLDYVDWSQIEKWFQTLAMGIDRFHPPWMGSRPSVRQWLAVFVQRYNLHRPHQALNDQTPAEVRN